MKKNDLIFKLNKAGLKIRKHSPEIFMVAGIIGTVASAVIACRATTKVNDILDEAKSETEKIHICSADETLSDKYSEEDAKKDLTIVYAQTGWKLVKLYAPSVVLGTLSIAGIVNSHRILCKRNMALAAAYTAVSTSFKEYRERVSERYGEEAEREIRYDIKAKQFSVPSDDDTGDTAETTVNVVNPDAGSAFTRFFDESSRYWKRDSDYNLMFLNGQQKYANDRLRVRGYLFLNEVLEDLGLPPTKLGQIVGWVYDPDHAVGSGDNYVDFGIFNVAKEKTRDFVNGYENVIMLDFNVDGVIWDLIDELGYARD